VYFRQDFPIILIYVKEHPGRADLVVVLDLFPVFATLPSGMKTAGCV
jgi:hypothetical protein